ncbi:Entericidin A/B family lipoprotein [Rhodovastum atsumiense]|uniref:Entericidin A/B family lipoprotein n=1 Tax=Rhodovastum atsumiense TaxID=504468 RepID=A0A5M6ITC3_9PROT|nr:entericidin A/B family lipoprotein [Rhodovastum atsumiense]KAA5611512.1 entericidin A/B family lipoprotein [Rhodovastum atsumiense]CAH2601212.1 Entericidin A/B family lipoprotein [Rhodovastum atsumiense]
MTLHPHFFRLVAVALLLASLGSLAGCNTTEGVGRDMSSAGRSLSNAADRNK